MSNLVPRSSGNVNPFVSDLNRNGQKAITRIRGNAIVQREADIERARTVGNRVDLEAALAIHTMDRAVDVIQVRRDLAQGDPDIDLALLPFQQRAFRNMQREQDNPFGLFG